MCIKWNRGGEKGRRGGRGAGSDRVRTDRFVRGLLLHLSLQTFPEIVRTSEKLSET